MFTGTVAAYDFDPTTSTKKSGKTPDNKMTMAASTAEAQLSGEG
jgi:hypothetical protein